MNYVLYSLDVLKTESSFLKTSLTVTRYPFNCLSWLLKLVHMKHFIAAQQIPHTSKACSTNHHTLYKTYREQYV